MGPLDGLRIVEMGAIGPTPFCAMLLADLGADVVRLDRADAVDRADGSEASLQPDYLLYRGRPSVAVDLKHLEAAELVLTLIEEADGFLEGFRPGVAERLGIGPEECLDRNPRLAYGRMTGWGQEGAIAQEPGHDINYIAFTGALDAIGRRGQAPAPPLNLIGDFGGGGMLLVVGVLAAIHAARVSGRGQVVDAAMVDGAALLATGFYGWRDLGQWDQARGNNLLDGGAHFYDVYETADGGYVSVGAVEPKFYAALLEVLGLAGEDLPDQYDKSSWPAMTERFAAVFRTRTRDEWTAAMAGAEACFAPVLSWDEARTHPVNLERETFIESAGIVQPAPAPRFQGTPCEPPGPVARVGEHTRAALDHWGVEPAEVERLLEAGAIRENPYGSARASDRHHE